MTWDELFDRAKVIIQALSILGPYVIWPALVWLFRVWRNLRALFVAVPKILKAMAIFANRERRGFDVDRRHLFYFRRMLHVLRNEARRQDWPGASQGAMEAIWQETEHLDRDIQSLRDTAFRAREMKSQRELREERGMGGEIVPVDQGELNAIPLGPIEHVLKG